MSEEDAGEVQIQCEGDIVLARKCIRNAAARGGFGVTDVTRIVTSTSELARNVFLYAGAGVLRWRLLEAVDRRGIELKFEDHGPGIPNVEEAMQPGFSSGRSLGMGLPGARRLMDEMEVQSVTGQGTTIVVRKWTRRI